MLFRPPQRDHFLTLYFISKWLLLLLLGTMISILLPYLGLLSPPNNTMGAIRPTSTEPFYQINDHKLLLSTTTCKSGFEPQLLSLGERPHVCCVCLLFIEKLTKKRRLVCRSLYSGTIQRGRESKSCLHKKYKRYDVRRVHCK